MHLHHSASASALFRLTALVGVPIMLRMTNTNVPAYLAGTEHAAAVERAARLFDLGYRAGPVLDWLGLLDDLAALAHVAGVDLGHLVNLARYHAGEQFRGSCRAVGLADGTVG